MTAYRGYAHIDNTTGKVVSTEVSGGSTQFFLSGAGGWSTITSGCTGPNKEELATNDINQQTLDFATATQSYAEWEYIMPANWNGGTITAIFYWRATSASTNSVIWGLQGGGYTDNEALDAALGNAVEVTDANNASDYLNISAETAAITLAGTTLAAGDLVHFKAYRKGSGDDNLAATAKLIGILVKYTSS